MADDVIPQDAATIQNILESMVCRDEILGLIAGWFCFGFCVYVGSCA